MSDPVVALLLLGLFIVFIFLGFPIAFTLMAMGIGFGYYAYFTPDQSFWDNRIFYLFTQNTFSVMNNDVLISIPLFLFMGYIIERANILDRLFLSLQVGLRFLPGSMAVAALVTCALFATATGIVGAVVTLMGLIALPAMLKAGYDQKLSAGVITAGGTLGILIPPSILLIVYAATASVSVVKLYAAAIIPGFALAALYVIYVIIRATLNPSLCPKPKDIQDYSVWQSILLVMLAFVPLAALIMAVLGSILLGLATPSLGDGVLPVRRCSHLRLGLLLPGRRARRQGCPAGAESHARAVLAGHAADHLHPGLAAGVERDHHHLRADLPAPAAGVWHRSDPLWHPDRHQPADLVLDATDGHVRLLPQGRGAQGIAAGHDFQGLHAICRHGASDPGNDLHLSCDGDLPARPVLQSGARDPRGSRR